MTGPANRGQSGGLPPAAAMSGAVDLAALAAKAEAARAAEAGADGAVMDVTDATFEVAVTRSNEQLVIVELHTPRAVECLELTQTLTALAQRDGRWLLARVDVDASPGIAQAFGVQSVPMVVALAGGQPVAAFNGPQPAEQIQSWIEEIFVKTGDLFAGGPQAAPPPPEDPRMVAAEELLNTGDVDAALAAYRQILVAEPGNTEAKAAAANLEFILRAQAHDPGIVDNAAPDDLDAQLAAADVLLLSQQPEAAFARVLAVVGSTVGDDKDRARTRLLELFELFDPADPLVVAARRKLAAALY